MDRSTLDTKLGEVFADESLAPYKEYLMYENKYARPGEGNEAGSMDQMTIGMLQNIGWSSEGIVRGLNFLKDVIKNGQTEQYYLYQDQKVQEVADQQMKDVNLFRIKPVKLDPKKPTCLLVSGGGYQAISAMIEGVPTARHLIDAGCQIFLLTYRVGTSKAALLALQDLAAAYRYLLNHKKNLSVQPNNIAVFGYSAGANLVANWGIKAEGYQAFNLPKPKAMVTVYPFIDLREECARDENGGLLKPMFGKEYESYIDRFNVVDHIDSSYPPCYIVCGKNDNLIDPRNSEVMKDLLEKAGVQAVLEEGNDAPHGFGDGTGTDVEGWPLRALQFIESL